MRITITTHKIPQNSRYTDLPPTSSLRIHRYIAQATIEGSSLNSSGTTREEAIDNLKTLIEGRFPELEQIEVTFPFEKPSKVPEGTDSLG
jgi:hypothetical protein